MHLVESFALNTGLKIDKPYIYEKFFPRPVKGEYITLQPFGKYDSRKYAYWGEVIDILAPVLKKNGISILQLGIPDEAVLHDCVDLRGHTDFNQAAYLIKNSLLHVGIDSFGVHFASGYNKKIVGIYCNMLPSQSGPYWSSRDNVIIIEPEREKNERPSYSPVETVKSINKIRPEEIAKSVCKLLGIELDYPYKTIRIGKEYHSRKIELIPSTFIENHEQLGVDSIILRMDHYFNETALQQQMLRCNCSVVTDKPINLDVVKRYRDRINEFVYFVDESTEPRYLELLKNTGVRLYLLTKLDEEALNKIKLKFIDLGNILKKPRVAFEDLDELKGKDLSNIYYKTGCYTIFQNDVYTSSVFSDGNDPVLTVRNVPPRNIIDDPDFWDQSDSYLLLEKIA